MEPKGWLTSRRVVMHNQAISVVIVVYHRVAGRLGSNPTCITSQIQTVSSNRRGLEMEVSMASLIVFS